MKFFEGTPDYNRLDMMGQLEEDAEELQDINLDIVRKDERKVVVTRGSLCG